MPAALRAALLSCRPSSHTEVRPPRLPELSCFMYKSAFGSLLVSVRLSSARVCGTACSLRVPVSQQHQPVDTMETQGTARAQCQWRARLLQPAPQIPLASMVGPEEAPGPPRLLLAQERPPGPGGFLLGAWPGHCTPRPRALRAASSQFLLQLSLPEPEPSGRRGPRCWAPGAGPSPSERP